MATSKFMRYFKDNATGNAATGMSVWLVPQSIGSPVYPNDYLACTEHSTRNGVYYRNQVPDGEYKIYIDVTGGTTPALYEQNIWVGENKISLIAKNFDVDNKLYQYGIKPIVNAGKRDWLKNPNHQFSGNELMVIDAIKKIELFDFDKSLNYRIVYLSKNNLGQYRISINRTDTFEAIIDTNIASFGYYNDFSKPSEYEIWGIGNYQNYMIRIIIDFSILPDGVIINDNNTKLDISENVHNVDRYKLFFGFNDTKKWLAKPSMYNRYFNITDGNIKVAIDAIFDVKVYNSDGDNIDLFIERIVRNDTGADTIKILDAANANATVVNDSTNVQDYSKPVVRTFYPTGNYAGIIIKMLIDYSKLYNGQIVQDIYLRKFLMLSKSCYIKNPETTNYFFIDDTKTWLAKPRENFTTNEVIIINAIKSVEIFNADPTKKYCISFFNKNHPTYKDRIEIYDAINQIQVANSYLDLSDKSKKMIVEVPGNSANPELLIKFIIDYTNVPDGFTWDNLGVITRLTISDSCYTSLNTRDYKSYAYVANGLKESTNPNNLYLALYNNYSKIGNQYIQYNNYKKDFPIRYYGEVKNKRFIALCYDDYRPFDYKYLIPLLNKYGFRGTFNYIYYSSLTNIKELQNTQIFNHEIGDHTYHHFYALYHHPEFDGVNTPSNSDMRSDRGDGKNQFGYLITSALPSGTWGLNLSGTTWATLTDNDCKLIRERFSIFKRNDGTNLLADLDNLSNLYCGTSGSSVWNGSKFTGGIFQDCTTSRNCEIWERVFHIMRCLHINVFGLNRRPTNYSLPGDYSFPYYEFNGLKYHDVNHLLPANDFAKCTSTLFGTRSLVDVMRGFGYVTSSDSNYEGRYDGRAARAVLHCHLNASYSKRDNLLNNERLIYGINGQYPFTQNTIIQSDGTLISWLQNSTDFVKSCYENDSRFKLICDKIVNQTSNGLIPFIVFDSTDDLNYRLGVEIFLQFCYRIGIEVITKAEQHDIAYNRFIDGNIFGNPNFRNTISYFISANNAQTAPDGWSGGIVLTDYVNGNNNVKVISNTSGSIKFTIMGVIPGMMKFSCYAKKGDTGASNVSIKIYKIFNKDNYGVPLYLANPSDTPLVINVTEDTYTFKEAYIYIEDAALRESIDSMSCQLYDDKVCGLQIELSGNIKMALPNLS